MLFVSPHEFPRRIDERMISMAYGVCGTFVRVSEASAWFGLEKFSRVKKFARRQSIWHIQTTLF